MTHESRETLNRVAGILEGLMASSDLAQAISDLLLNSVEMIDEVLKKEEAK